MESHFAEIIPSAEQDSFAQYRCPMVGQVLAAQQQQREMASVLSGQLSTALAQAWHEVEVHAAMRAQAEAMVHEVLAQQQEQTATIDALRRQLAEEENKRRQKEERRSNALQDALRAKRKVLDAKRKRVERLQKACKQRQPTVRLEDQPRSFKAKRRRRPCTKNWCELSRRSQNRKLAELKRKVKEFSSTVEEEFDQHLRVKEVVVEPTHCAGATEPGVPEAEPNAPAAENTQHVNLNDVVYKVKLAEDLVTKISARRVLAEARRLQRDTPGRLRTPLSSQHLLKIRRLVAAKDAGLTSNRGYRLLAKADPSMQRWCRLESEMKRQNAFIDVKGIPEAIDGARRPIKDVLEHVLALDGIKEKVLAKKSVKLRFAADGRKTTKAKKTVMCVVSVMEEEEHVGHQGMEQQYCIAVFEGDEDYADLQACLSDVLDEMQDVRDSGLEVCGTHIDVEWYLCSDWKFLAEFLGLNAANAQFFCLWCFCSKADIDNLDKPLGTWQIERTFEECCTRKGRKATADRCGSKSNPLFKVDFRKVFPDTLHLFLRIVEKVYKGLADWAIVEGKMSEFEEEALKAGVLFTFREDPGSGKMRYTELDAGHAYKLLSGMDLEALVGGVMEAEKAERTKLIWRLLDQLYTALRVPTNHPSYLQPHDFHNTAKIFARNLKWVVKDSSITPYIHALIFHVPQFLDMYGTIYQVNCQLVELKNNHHNAIFHRGSQKGGRQSSYCRQVLQRENRYLFARVHGTRVEQEERSRRVYRMNEETRERRLQQLKQHRANLLRRRAVALARKAKRGRKKK